MRKASPSSTASRSTKPRATRKTAAKPRRSRGQGTRLAAIDIGSNSIRQIIAEVFADGRIRIIDELKAAPRLGAGVDEHGIMSDASIQSAIAALKRMTTLARQSRVARIEAVATSAVRDAANGRGFLDLVRRECGLKVRLLSGDDEARLAFRSAQAHFDLGGARTVVMDIGGGSLELATAANGLLDQLASFPFGAIRLTEQFLGDKPTRKAVRKLRKMVREAVKETLSVRDWRRAQLICSGGTFTNLAGMYLYRQGVTSAAGRVHATRVPRDELEHIIDLLQASSPTERAAIRGLNPGRADIILAGLCVAAEVMAHLECPELVVSAYGIREGILLEAARVRSAPADPGDARERSVRAFAERCHYEEGHARHVQRLALQLFDAIGPRLGATSVDREILSDAALLHDVGYHINYDKHHKHSQHLIMHAELLGMAPEEQLLIANVARYHRGSEPRLRHTAFGALDREARRRVEILSALLRVADGFDRGHVSAVQQLKVRWTERAIRIHATPMPRVTSLRLELWGAERKAGLLSTVTGMPVEIIAPDGSRVQED